jgi:thiamine biosynthesis protein ThiS
MNIRLNGNPHNLAAPLTAAALLESLGLAGRPVVMEIDEQAVFPRDYPTREISDGAKVEIVTLAAGG